MFSSANVSRMEVSGELIAYFEYDVRIGREVLRVRTAGANRRFEPQGGDDQIVDIFTAVPSSIFLLPDNFDIQSDRLVFVIQEVTTQVEHLVEVVFPNGVGGVFIVAIPSASTAMSPIPPNYTIMNVEIGTNGAIAFKLLDIAPRLPQPQPPPREHMARVMSAGPNGQWEYTQPSDDREYILNSGGGISTMLVSLSQGNEFVAHAQIVTGHPRYGFSLLIHYFGPDAIPQTGDGEYMVGIPEGGDGEIQQLEIEGFLPASGNMRSSASRLLYVMDDRYNQSPTFTEVLKFKETGSDNRYGTGDDIVWEQRPISNAMATISNIGLADRFRVWSEATGPPPSSIVYGAVGCW